MAPFTRPDSPYWWLYLETAATGHNKLKKEKTSIRIGKTVAERRDSKLKAEALYHKRMNEIASRIHRLSTMRPAIRFNDYADTYARDVLSHHKGQARELEMLKSLRAGFGDSLLQTIDVERVRAWMTIRRSRVSASTVNREVDLLKSMLRDAAPKYLEASPLAGMKRLKAPPAQRGTLTREDECRILAACGSDVHTRALIIVAIDTVQRLSALLSMRRADRSPDGLWIYIRDTKNGRSNTVPLSPDAAAALDWLEDAGEYYFSRFRVAKNPRDWKSSVRQRIERVCADAAVKFGRNARLTWHWMTRRTGASRLVVERGVPIPIAQRIGGWTRPDVMLQIYSEANADDLLEAVGRSRPVPGRRQATNRT